MTIYDVMNNSPFLTFWLSIAICATVGGIIVALIRRANIKQHGYPPYHCDATGELRKKDE